MAQKTWKNYGDMDFLAWGGCLVSPHWDEETLQEHPDWRDEFDVFYLHTEYGEDGNQMAASLHYVKVSDYEKDKEDYLYPIGLEEHAGKPMEEIMSLEMWAKEIVEQGAGDQPSSYHSQYPSAPEDFIISDEELEKWLKDIGAYDLIAGNEEKAEKEA